MAYDGVGVCGGTYSEGDGWSVALWAKEGFTGACALIPRESGVIHRLVAPEEGTPQVYIFRDTFTGPFEARLGPRQESQNYRITAFLLVRPNYQPRFGWHRMLDEAWRQHNYFHQPRHCGEDLWRRGIDYTKNGLWSEEGVFKGFCIRNAVVAR